MPNPDPPYVSLTKVCDTQLLLSFEPIAGAIKYTIYKQYYYEKPWQMIGTAPGTATGVIVTPYNDPTPNVYNNWGASVTTAAGTSTIASMEGPGNPTTIYGNYPIGVIGKVVSVPCVYNYSLSGPQPAWEITDPYGTYNSSAPGGYSVSTSDGTSGMVTCSSNTFNGIGYYNAIGNLSIYIPDGSEYQLWEGCFLVESAYHPCQQGPGC